MCANTWSIDFLLQSKYNSFGQEKGAGMPGYFNAKKKKVQLNPYLTLFTIINLKQIIYLNVNDKTINHLKTNKEENLHNLRQADISQDTKKELSIKEKLINWYFGLSSLKGIT